LPLLEQIVTHPQFDALHGHAGKFVKLIGGRVPFVWQRKPKSRQKHAAARVIFEEFGLEVLRTHRCHDIPTLIHTLEC